MSEKYERLNEEIEKRGIKQKQLIGHKRGVYGTWERNPDKITLGNLRIVCKALEIDIGELHGQIDALKAISTTDGTLDGIIKAISNNGYEITINFFKTGEKNHE